MLVMGVGAGAKVGDGKAPKTAEASVVILSDLIRQVP
jgi:hypothetical protein